MASLKGMGNFTLQQEIIMWASSDLTRKKEEESTLGLARKVMFMKESSKEGREMEGERSGGQTVVGMRASSETECSQVQECCTEKVATDSLRVIGTTACLMVEELSTSRTERDMRALSRRISSMERAFSTKMTRSYMECGRTTNCRW